MVADDGRPRSRCRRAERPRRSPRASRPSQRRTSPTSRRSSCRTALGFFRTTLLVFAFIALFVGAFIIFNTFSIIVAQRTREMALLRAIGASRRQVLTSVVIEAFVTGLVASALGLLAGIGIAIGLQGLLAAFGVDLPSTSTQLQSADRRGGIRGGDGRRRRGVHPAGAPRGARGAGPSAERVGGHQGMRPCTAGWSSGSRSPGRRWRRSCTGCSGTSRTRAR